jgi:hypothetical protein
MMSGVSLEHVKQLRNIGKINSTTRSHLVGSFYKIYIMMHGSVNMKFNTEVLVGNLAHQPIKPSCYFFIQKFSMFLCFSEQANCFVIENYLTVCFLQTRQTVTMFDLQLEAQILIYLHIIHSLKSSKCFKHHPARLQEVHVATVRMQPLVPSSRWRSNKVILRCTVIQSSRDSLCLLCGMN